MRRWLNAVIVAAFLPAGALAFDVSSPGAGAGSCTLPNLVRAVNVGSGPTCAQPSSVTGNAATATASDHTPTTCSAGNYPLGVDASWNATGCTSATGAGTVIINGNPAGGSVAVFLGAAPSTVVSSSPLTAINGNFGIGNTNPGTTLDVTGGATIRGQETITSTLTVIGGTINGAVLNISGGAVGRIPYQSAVSQTQFASTFTMVAGKLGIGVSAPANRLELSFDVDASTGLRIYRATSNQQDWNGQGGPYISIGSGEDQHVGNIQPICFGGSGSPNTEGQAMCMGYVAETTGGTLSGGFGVAVRNTNGHGDPLTESFRVKGIGVFVSSSPAPTVSSSAGTPAPVAGSTQMFGGGVAGAASTAITFTFANAWPKTPFCICGDDTSLVAVRPSAVSTTALTCAGAAIGGDTINYICMGPP